MVCICRSCRARLQQHNVRRRKRDPLDTSAKDLPTRGRKSKASAAGSGPRSDSSHDPSQLCSPGNSQELSNSAHGEKVSMADCCARQRHPQSRMPAPIMALMPPCTLFLPPCGPTVGAASLASRRMMRHAGMRSLRPADRRLRCPAPVTLAGITSWRLHGR